MNLLFTICGRAGSQGVKGKNVRSFCGLPLVWYTCAAIELYSRNYTKPSDVVKIVLSTDSDELICLVQQTRQPVWVIRRSAELSENTVPKAAVIKDCMERAEEEYQCSFDLVVDLDITSPLRTVEDIRAAVLRKEERPDADVVYSVVPSRRNPYFNMVKSENGFFVKAIPSRYTARQQAPVFFDMNASIYAYSPRALREKELEAFFNDRCDAILMRDTGILDIDSEEDYELMQVIAAYLFEKKAGYKEVSNAAKRYIEGAQGHE